MASQGNLLLLNHEGKVVLEVDSPIDRLALESRSPGSEAELLKLNTKILTPDDGNIAPPPTALEAGDSSRYSSMLSQYTPKHHPSTNNDPITESD